MSFMYKITDVPIHQEHSRRMATLLAWIFWSLVIACAVMAFILRMENGISSSNTGVELLAGILYWGILIPLAPPTYATVGAIVAARRPKNAVGWLCLVGALVVSLEDVAWQYADRALILAPHSLPAGPFFAMVSSVLEPTFLLLPTLLLLLFPVGRLLSHRWRVVIWIAGTITLLGMFATIFYPTIATSSSSTVVNPIGIRAFQPIFDIINTIFYWVAFPLLLVGVISVAVRWRRSRGEERQQLKWLVYIGTVIVIAGAMAIISQYLPLSPYAPILLGAISIAGLSFGIPIAIGVAMLRYRLYDIDVLINRTIVYGTLTGILGLIYMGCILVSQFLLRGLTQKSDLAIVGSTLAIAALFQPLRRTIQKAIDRRFYRRKYDAASTLASFSSTLCSEVDLTQLSQHLVAVVEETMQPTHISLWLRKSEEKKNRPPS